MNETQISEIIGISTLLNRILDELERVTALIPALDDACYRLKVLTERSEE